MPDRAWRARSGEPATASPINANQPGVAVSVAAAHDGNIVAELNEPHGLRVTLTCPPAASTWHTPPASVPSLTVIPQALGTADVRW